MHVCVVFHKYVVNATGSNGKLFPVAIAIKKVALGLCRELVACVLQRLFPKMQVPIVSVLLLAAATITLGKKVEYWGTDAGKLQELVVLPNS